MVSLVVVETLALLDPQESVPLVPLVKKDKQAFLEAPGLQVFQVSPQGLKGQLQGHRNKGSEVQDTQYLTSSQKRDVTGPVLQSSPVSDGSACAQRPQIS